MSGLTVLDANGNPMTLEMVLGQAGLCDAKAEEYRRVGMHKLKNRAMKTAADWRKLAARMLVEQGDVQS